MNALLFDATLNDEQRRQQLYDGALVMLSPTPHSLRLCQFAQELASEARDRSGGKAEKAGRSNNRRAPTPPNRSTLVAQDGMDNAEGVENDPRCCIMGVHLALDFRSCSKGVA